MNTRGWGVIAGALAVGVTGLIGGCGAADVASSPGWTRVPDLPLSGRTGASTVSVEQEVLVFGGSHWMCPPGADCAVPDDEPLADGAVYNMRSGRWRPMADAPVGLVHASVTTLDGDVYAMRRCEVGPTCAAGSVMLRYRTADDGWDALAVPPGHASQHVVAVGDRLVAVADSDELGEDHDYVYDIPTDTWTALPNDPLPLSYGRFAVEVDGRLLLFSTPLDHEPPTKEVASLDLASGVWSRLPGSQTSGYQAWRSGDLVYLNPHFAQGGGVFDPVADVWSPLPEAEPEFVDMAGVIGHGSATFEYSSGWVLDTEAGKWVEIPARPGGDEVYDESVTAIGEALFVIGGQRWSTGKGELPTEVWAWATD